MPKKVFLFFLPLIAAAQTCSTSQVGGSSIYCLAYANGSGAPMASATLPFSTFQAGDVLVVGDFLQRQGSPSSAFNSAGGNITATQTSIPYNAPPAITTNVTTSTSSLTVQLNASSSATSLTIQTGSTGSITTGTTYPVGMLLQIVSSASPTNYMYGTVTGSTPLVVSVTSTNGSGTFASWNISSAFCNAFHNDRLGEVIAGSAFPAGTTVQTCVDPTHITVSAPATSTGSISATIQFAFPSVTGIAAVAPGSSPGSGYPLGAILDVTQAGSNSMGQVEVTSVGTGGTVTGVRVTSTTPANFLTASGYSIANNISTTCVLPVSGCGTGATIDIIDIGWIKTVTDSGLGPGYEKMLVTGDDGTTYTVRRGYSGTVAIPHMFSGACSTCVNPYGAYNPGPSPVQILDFQDTARNVFNCVFGQTEYTDTNTVPLTFCYATFTTATAAAANLAGHDIVTMAQPFQIGNLNTIAVAWYRGDGAVSGISNPIPTDGYASNPIGGGTAFNTSMIYNSVVPSVPNTGWSVSPGDHVIVLAGGELSNVPVNGTGAVYPTGGAFSVTVSGGNTVTGTGFPTLYGAWPPGTPVNISGATGNPYHIASNPLNGTSLTMIETTIPNGSALLTVADQGAQPNPSTGWVLRATDATGNRFGFVDNIATGSTANGGIYQQSSIDGMFTIGVAFHPSSPAIPPQSVSLTTSSVANGGVSAQTPGFPWRVDFELHNWATTGWSGTQTPLLDNPVGVGVQMINTGGNIQLGVLSYRSGNICTIPGLGPIGGNSLYTNLAIKVRYQEFATATPPFDTCQAWDINGVMVYNQVLPYVAVSGVNSAGISVSGLGAGANLDIAYSRIFTSTVPFTARPPVNAESATGCLVMWNFEGNLNDSCAAYTGTPSGGVSYVNTPGVNLVVPIIYSRPFSSIPAQDQWLPLTPTQGLSWDVSGNYPAASPFLDATQSYSDIGASATVTCGLTKSGGSPAGTITSPSSLTSTVTGAAAGDFNITASCTDGANMGSASIDIGAIAMNPSGQAITGNPNADFFFGPLISLGANPWGYQDYWHIHASDLRATNYVSQLPTGVGTPWITGPSNKPQWEYTGGGTVSFYFNCIGGIYFCNGTQYSGTLTGGSVTTGQATPFTISTATGLDLSTFPAHIILYDAGSGIAGEVSVCSGSTSLTPCYDGWGNQSGGQYAATPHTFPVGSLILQSKVIGTGTHFLATTSDTPFPVAPLGAGPPGPSLYTGGSIALTPGSPIIAGSGTAWTSAMATDFIRVSASYSGGTPFVFVAQIASASAGSIMLTRPYPPSADALSGVTAYNILAAQRTIDLRYPHATDSSGPGQLMFGTSDCTSDTVCWLNPFGAYNTFAGSHDVVGPFGSIDGEHVTSASCSGCGVYSITDSTGWINEGATGGISFYCESCAHRELYLRSGLTSAKTAADQIANYWMPSPWGNADGGGWPTLYIFGEGIGTFAHAVIDSVPSLWPDLRGYGYLGVQHVAYMTANGCNADDTRDTGGANALLILAAIYDPDTTSTNAPGGIPWRTYWQNNLAQMQTNDTACQDQAGGGVNAFANAAYFNAIPAQSGFPVLTMTNGSAIATALTTIPASLCDGTGAGTATLVNNSNAITISGTIPAGTTNLFLTGTTGGGATVFVQSVPYSLSSPGVIGAYWHGDPSSSVGWISSPSNGYPGTLSDMFTIGEGNSDLANMQKSWGCIQNSSTQITLNRPWDGVSSGVGHVFHPYTGNLAGYGQQPFMLGIKTYSENLLAAQTLPALSSYVAPYSTFRANSTAWLWSTGMDHQLLGTSYGRLFQQCEPTNMAPPGTSFIFRSSGCTYGSDPVAVYLSREQNAETGAAHSLYYQANPTSGNGILGSQFYGALWGFCPWTASTVYCDTNSTAANAAGSNLNDTSLVQGKWFGFFAGMGFSSRWPAVIAGGGGGPSQVPISGHGAK